MNFLNWNVRGINSTRKRQILADIVKEQHIDILALQETKKETFTDRILRTISRDIDEWKWLPSQGTSGGILFGCNSTKFRIVDCHLRKFSMDVLVECLVDNNNWVITVVYAPVDYSLKREFWQELQYSSGKTSNLWVLCGDFNAIRLRNEKSGTSFNIRLSTLFNHFVNSNSLVELKVPTRKYSWTNGTQSALLDRFFVSLDWDDTYAFSHVDMLSKYGSDHCPLVLKVPLNCPKQTMQFKFDPTWVLDVEFCTLIEKWWQEFPLDINNLGYSWNAKLKYMRRKIKGWARNFYGAKRKLKKNALDNLARLEQIQEVRNFTITEFEQWSECKKCLDDIYLEEELYWKIRSKQIWLEEGDGNTKFFHRIASHRKRKNTISALEIEGQISNNIPEISNHISQYYKEIFGVPGIKYASLDQHFWADNELVTQEENSSLIQPFSEEEIKVAVFASDPTGAPGPDGFTFKFYQHFWDVVKFDLLTLVAMFFLNQVDLSKLNKASVCLIPKEEAAIHIKQFRPISLVNCSFKIISKLLTNRLEVIIDRLIDVTQAAFIKGRYILDNVVLGHEIIHYCQTVKQKGVVIKVDFEKAYDKIN